MIGWDIGGVNTKAARVTVDVTTDAGAHTSARIETAMRPFEVQREPSALAGVLQTLAGAIGARDDDLHALTMTAELSQMFRRKRDGVAFVIEAVVRAFPSASLAVYGTHGSFLTPAAARAAPLVVAAANWAATARALAPTVGTAVLVDVGTTTTDVIPIVDGAVCAEGWTDPDRLRSGELLYLGAVRTPVEAIVQTVPLHGASAGVSAEAFALAGDVYLWRGALTPEFYTAPTPDGRAATRDAAGERLARIVCGDRELLDDEAIDRLAAAVAVRQIERTGEAIARVRRRHPTIESAIVLGVGDFIAAAAATAAGLDVRWLAEDWGAAAARVGPAAAVALLRARAVA